ncbi:MAG: hypothetical protein E7396_07960 [Ruminococcaceae bacterium]|nr:hypothetical protein [Oscillospiraceae bacterium]
MKKLLSIILVVSMLFASAPLVNVFAETQINVTINSVSQSYDVMPLIENGRTLVPMRGIFEALGAEIKWDDETKTVTGTKGDTNIILKIGSTLAKVNDKDVTLDVAAKIIGGRTFVPVRFVSESLGCKVDWDNDTKTVIINSSSTKLAKLVSTFHRPVPTEFTKSNDLYDIMHFEGATIEQQEASYNDIKSKGEVVCTEDEFLESISTTGEAKYGTSEVVEVEGQTFKKALRITCTTPPAATSGFITRTKATPERNPGDGVAADDVMLLVFRMRTLSTNSPDSIGQVQVQIEHPTSYKKSLFEKAISGSEWTVIYLPFTGVEDATAIGIRGGFYTQVVELGGIEIINLGKNFDINTLPKTTAILPELEPESPWRKDAIDRIEKIRKGDFTVIVKDAEGNVIPDAQIELDMFEHQFEFGTMTGPNTVTNENYRKTTSINFNAGVSEHFMKWAPFEETPDQAKNQVQAAKELGIKYFRGHSIFWERHKGSDKTTNMTPDYMFTDDVLKSKEKFDELCKKHLTEIVTEFKDYVKEWDVENELITNTAFKDIYGMEIYKNHYKWVREILGDDAELYYNDFKQFEEPYYKLLDEMVAMDIDFDGIGIQSHYDGSTRMPSEVMRMYEGHRKYGKRLKVTEYSNSIEDKAQQANYTRDMLISCFAEEMMDGFLMWGYCDGPNASANRPFYDTEWNLKPAGLVYQDLVYNKWWTRDAKATTDKNGVATIRGFYGDYDVTVTANGKTVTDMVAFHKGYDNELEIVIK